MILVGDVGGTKTRIALLEPDGAGFRIAADETYRSRDFAGLLDVLHAFRHAHTQRVERAAFGVAGPVRGGAARLTNLGWTVEADGIARDLSLGSVAVVNDLEAVARGIASLGPDGVVQLAPGSPEARGNRAVVAAGTGLGHAGLVFDGREHVALASEAGHAGFAPADELQEELLHHLRRELDPVCVEHVVSGPGLVRIHRFLRDSGRGDEPDWLAAELASGDPAAAISRAALEGRSKLCEEALDLFVAAYAGAAAQFALSILATGGVWLGGGIAPRILRKLSAPAFLRAFAGKGDLADLLRAIPVRAIVDDRVALYGAARSSATPAQAAAVRTGRSVRVCDDAPAMARAACEEIVARALDATGTRGRFALALGGGAGMRPLLAELAASGLPWDKVHVFFADERCVPPEHPGSNFRAVREALLSKVAIPEANVHRVQGEHPAPGRAAIEYEVELRRVLGSPEGEMPRLDLVALSLGADGHVASLFPGTGMLDERERAVAAGWVEKVGSHRITLTIPALNAARCVLVLAAGRDKAAVLREVLSPAPARSRIPARLVQPADGALVWIADREAAAGLEAARAAS